MKNDNKVYAVQVFVPNEGMADMWVFATEKDARAKLTTVLEDGRAGAYGSRCTAQLIDLTFGQSVLYGKDQILEADEVEGPRNPVEWTNPS